MEFGYHQSSFAFEEEPLGDALLDRAQFVEDAGFTWFSLMDHFWQLPGIGRKDEPLVECYAGLSAIAAATDSIELSGLVTCVHYRNPAYLAKLVGSLDSLSDGRAVLGIGAGWYDEEYDAIGIEFPDAAERVRQLRDVIRLCETAWYEESPVDYEGEYYTLDELYLDPKPDDVPILVGGGGEQLTLRLTAEYADRWNVPGADPEEYEHKLAVLYDHCQNEGRDYEDIEKTITLRTVVRDDSDGAHETYERLLEESVRGPVGREEFRGLVGTAGEVAELIETYGDLGVDTLQVEVLRDDRESLERFVDDVMPEFS